MNEILDKVIADITANNAEQTDYKGEDGLLYCGKCHTPKEAYFSKEHASVFGRDRHPSECECRKAERIKREEYEKRQKHLQTVEYLKHKGFIDQAMRNWTFANDNGRCEQMKMAHRYVDNWEHIKDGNYGLLLWGNVGRGKSYFAGCIANALMEQEVSVHMTNFPLIINDLSAKFEGRNEYIARICSFALLIIDDLGVERGTEYGLEQVYNVIDSRNRSNKPLIITTNLTLQETSKPH